YEIQYLAVAYVVTPGLAFQVAAVSAKLGQRRNEYLHVGIRADDRADVRPVEDGARLVASKLALKREQRRTHPLDPRHDRCRLLDACLPQLGVGQTFGIEIALALDSRGFVLQ